MNDESAYQLICQLIQHEQKKLWPDTQVIDMDSILSKLKMITGIDYGDNAEEWVNWFTRDSGNERKEIESLQMIWRIHNIEKISLKKIRDGRS